MTEMTLDAKTRGTLSFHQLQRPRMLRTMFQTRGQREDMTIQMISRENSTTLRSLHHLSNIPLLFIHPCLIHRLHHQDFITQSHNTLIANLLLRPTTIVLTMHDPIPDTRTHLPWIIVYRDKKCNRPQNLHETHTRMMRLHARIARETIPFHRRSNTCTLGNPCPMGQLPNILSDLQGPCLSKMCQSTFTLSQHQTLSYTVIVIARTATRSPAPIARFAIRSVVMIPILNMQQCNPEWKTRRRKDLHLRHQFIVQVWDSRVSNWCLHQEHRIKLTLQSTHPPHVPLMM